MVEQYVSLQNFLVLGLIPGTNIQISFTAWLVFVLSVFTIWEVRRFIHSGLLAAISMRRALTKNAQANLAVSELSL